MNRTLIAWNLPNMVTVPLMVVLAFLIVSIIWQIVQQWVMPGQAGATNAA